VCYPLSRKLRVSYDGRYIMSRLLVGLIRFVDFSRTVDDRRSVV
jgi:hypothetical protein